MPSRDPRLCPVPGDEVGGPKLKAKVFEVSFNESGISEVRYSVTTVNGRYQPNHLVKVSLAQWTRFVHEGATILNLASPRTVSEDVGASL